MWVWMTLVKKWDECCSPRGLQTTSACRESMLKGNKIKHSGICGQYDSFGQGFGGKSAWSEMSPKRFAEWKLASGAFKCRSSQWAGAVMVNAH